MKFLCLVAVLASVFVDGAKAAEVAHHLHCDHVGGPPRVGVKHRKNATNIKKKVQNTYFMLKIAFKKMIPGN